MPAYMDKNGFQHKDWKDYESENNKAERWIKKRLERGATIPEVWWELFSFYFEAFDNVRFDRMMAEQEARKAKRAKARKKSNTARRR